MGKFKKGASSKKEILEQDEKYKRSWEHRKMKKEQRKSALLTSYVILMLYLCLRIMLE